MEVAKQIQRQIEFTRYYQDIGVHTPVWHDVDRIIRNAIEMLPLQTLTVDCEVAGLEIYADPLIEKVFYNLMENTLRHGKNATRISCSYPAGRRRHGYRIPG